jgi:thiamine-monophosphate kinase
MGEFELIRQFFLRPAESVTLGNGDDCALIDARAGMVLAVSTDMLVAGRHFFHDASPHAIGFKALAVNLSDLAAMSARPRAFTLALALPESDPAWLSEFSHGLFECADAAACELIGGDTTRGPLTISITVFGDVIAEHAPRRSGGKVGDHIWVSGELGGAAYALACEKKRRGGQAALGNGADVTPANLQRRLDYPEARIRLGESLGTIAHAMIDISDGLLGDLGHILRASGCGAVVDESRLPAPSLPGHLSALERRALVLSGGDDYELCFTAAPSMRERIEKLGRDLNIELTLIGELTAGEAIELIGTSAEISSDCSVVCLAGFDHFA